MRWSEIDRVARTWLIPAERMKGKVSHLVPLNELAIELLGGLRRSLQATAAITSFLRLDRMTISIWIAAPSLVP